MHREWEEQLAFYAAGSLSPGGTEALEHHLAGCAACRTALDGWRRLGAAVQADAAAWASAAPPLAPELRARLTSPLPASTNGHGKHLPSFDADLTLRHVVPAARPHWWRPSLTSAAALLVVILFGTLLVYLAAPREPDEPKSLAAPSTHTPAPPLTTTPLPGTSVAAEMGGMVGSEWDLGILPTFTSRPPSTLGPSPRASAPPSIVPTPAAMFGGAIGGGYTLITLQDVGDIPQGARVRVSHAWYDGSGWLYVIVPEDERTTAEAREGQLAVWPGYDPAQPTHTPTRPSPSASPTLPPGFVQWAEADIGVRFDFPAGWYTQRLSIGLGTGVKLTTFDPANAPPLAGWGPGTLELDIVYAPAAPADLLAWVAAERAEFTAAGLDVIQDRRLTLPGARHDGWTLALVSSSGHTLNHFYTEIAGRPYRISSSGDSDLAAAVIATLRAAP